MDKEKLIKRVVFLSFALMMAILIIYVTRPAKPTGFEPYVVKAGDTLWEIAETVTPKGEDVRRVVELIKVRNAMKDSGIQIGELLDVPIYGGEK